jgi:hypothetical protein
MEKPFKLTAAVGLAFMLLASVYASYPRFDNYYNSRGYSTGEADITSVKRAEERADGEKYIALANQQVSAAALHEFGFHNRYIEKDGQEIGKVNNCGQSYGAHLHLELEVSSSAEAWVQQLPSIKKYGKNWYDIEEYLKHYGVTYGS